jgi:hypothetical protein
MEVMIERLFFDESDYTRDAVIHLERARTVPARDRCFPAPNAARFSAS